MFFIYKYHIPANVLLKYINISTKSDHLDISKDFGKKPIKIVSGKTKKRETYSTRLYLAT